MSVHLRFLTTCLCFFFSGVAALIYQIAWTRQFALVFGTSELAVAAVLAAYMAGLALGARVVESLLPRIRQPVRWYAWLEAGIGAAALLWVPMCLWLAEQVLVNWVGGQSAPPDSGQTFASVFYAVAALLTLLVPTALMGATLPLLVRDGVRSQEQIGQRVGLLYVCNTAGAVVGALVASLWLLSAWGLRGTVWVAALINLAVAGLALLVFRPVSSSLPEAVAEPTEPASVSVVDHERSAVWILPLMLVSGAVSFVHEVLWTRMLSHVLGGSIIAFGVMLASFLGGIALGGALGAWLARSRVSAARVWALAQVVIMLAAMLAWYGVQHWAPVDARLPARVMFGLLVLLPLSTAIGVTYPLAVRVLARDAGDAALVSARVYSWNTVGAIAGALLGGFWLIPALRFEGSVHLAVCASAVLAVGAMWLVLQQDRRWCWGVTAVAVFAAASFWPAVPEALLRQSPLRKVTGELEFYAVGRAADVTVFRNDAAYDLRTNGLPEAGVDVLGAPATASAEAMMSPLAVLARPQTQSMLIVGFGGGNVVQGVPPSVQQVDVIELEPQVIAANQALAGNRNRNPLLDQRVNVILNDARGALLLTNKKYDAVVSQPSHPWTAGASHLYTQQFMQQVRNHLNPGGVFVQWMSTDFMDESLLRSLLATLGSVFEEVRVYRTAPNTLLLMGSDQPLQPERDVAGLTAVLTQQSVHYSRLGINGLEDLLAMWVLDTQGARQLASGADIITDDRNRLATSGVFDFDRAMSPADTSRLLAGLDPLTNTGSLVYQELLQHIRFPSLVDAIAAWSSTDATYGERALRMIDLRGDTDEAVYMRHALALRLGQEANAQQILAEGLKRYPRSELLNYALLEPSLGQWVAGQVTAQVNDAVRQLSSEPLMVVQGLMLASQDRWGEVAALDARLAAVPLTAPWASHAQQLRVEWRTRVGNKELRPRYGTEAIAILDRMLLSQNDGFLYALRALNAVGMDQPHLMLESIAAFARLGEEKASVLTGSEKVLFQLRVTQLLGLLDNLRTDGRVAASRVEQLRIVLLRLKAS